MGGNNLAVLKSKIGILAEKHNLSLVLLYGSQASGKIRKDSDIDIAVLGISPISTEELIGLHNEFAQIFEAKEIDVKSLHNTDSLFRYQVMQMRFSFMAEVMIITPLRLMPSVITMTARIYLD